ncbi:hypothetical protein CDAR_464321 [Caerostris darwini]|uniref:Uncharacterized protein n=1 Tax=Caerostris darwini TaxID=1538125 RepID=A0AAV4VTL2_9ARAC|nr:hypothetical protein CDAR_464321 [Caerostris darwini]
MFHSKETRNTTPPPPSQNLIRRSTCSTGWSFVRIGEGSIRLYIVAMETSVSGDRGSKERKRVHLPPPPPPTQMFDMMGRKRLLVPVHCNEQRDKDVQRGSWL